MEPLSIQAAGLAAPRSALALGSDLAAVLREGRVVAGQVLERLDGSTVLIGLGRHRVPAESQVELAPGQRFVARVEAGADGPNLRVLGGAAAGAEPALVTALRAAVGSERPVGELLNELAGKLKALIDAGGDGAETARRIASALEGHLVRPGTAGAELRALLLRAGHGYEAVLLAGLRGRDPRAAGDLADELAEHVRRLLMAQEAAPGEPSAIARVRQVSADLHEALARALALAHANGAGKPELGAALRAVIDEALRAFPASEHDKLRAAFDEAARALLREPAGEALVRRAFGLPPREGVLAAPAEELAERLAGELLRRAEGTEPAAPRLTQLARALGPAVGRALEAAFALGSLDSAALLQALEKSLPRALEALPEALRATALGVEPAELLRAVFAGPAGESLGRRLALLAGALQLGATGFSAEEAALLARSDLKATLLGALGELPDGPARGALGRALAGLESEQLLNLARRELGEGSHVALPFPDGDRWSTLHLFRHPRHRGGGGQGASLERVGLALELTNLGPVRAELGWRTGELHVRFLVADERIADAVRNVLQTLRERLAAGGDVVELRVAVADAAELETDRHALDVGYLREHPLLDLSG